MPRFSLGAREYNFGETVARFSEILYSDQEAYKALHDRYIDMGPFGFYAIPILAASTLLIMQDNGEVDFSDEGESDWVESTDRIMNEIMRRALDADENVPLSGEPWISSVVRDVMRKPKDWSPR